jgi:adenylate cyclase
MLSYSVNGDAANLASRLEGLNKHYGTGILVGEATFAEVQAHVTARPIDRVVVKGRAQAVTVYELVGLRAETTPKAVRAAALYASAFEHFFARRFAESLAALDELTTLAPEDGPARLLRERCLACVASPPGADWDGAARMAEK